MANILSRQIRNVCLLGHGGSGKTSLAEALLYYAKDTDRLGKISEGNTVCDFDPEEIRREMSVSASIAPIFYDNKKINFIDTIMINQSIGVINPAVSCCKVHLGVTIFLFVHNYLLLKLTIIQRTIESTHTNQLFMASLFCNLPLLQYQNTVSILYGGKTMSNNKTGTVTHKLTHSLLNLNLCTRVYIRGCFI